MQQTFQIHFISFSVLIFGVKLLLNGSRNPVMDSYMFSILYKFIHISIPLTPEIHRMGNALNILYLRCKEQKESQLYSIFYSKLSIISLDFISKLVNLNTLLVSLSKLLSKRS